MIQWLEMCKNGYTVIKINIFISYILFKDANKWKELMDTSCLYNLGFKKKVCSKCQNNSIYLVKLNIFLLTTLSAYLL